MIKSAVALNKVVSIQDWADTVAVSVDGEHVLSFTGVTASDLDINAVAGYVAEVAGFLKHPTRIRKIPAHPSLLRRKNNGPDFKTSLYVVDRSPSLSSNSNVQGGHGSN